MFQWAVGHGMQAAVALLKGCPPSNDDHNVLECCLDSTWCPSAAVTFVIIGGSGVVRHPREHALGRVLLHLQAGIRQLAAIAGDACTIWWMATR
jgi:hypothetical protein